MKDCEHANVDTEQNDFNELMYVCQDCGVILDGEPGLDRDEWNAERLYDDD